MDGKVNDMSALGQRSGLVELFTMCFDLSMVLSRFLLAMSITLWRGLNCGKRRRVHEVYEGAECGFVKLFLLSNLNEHYLL